MMGNNGAMFFGGGFMWIFWLLLIAVVLIVIKATLAGTSQRWRPKDDSPIGILKKRYANGEIDEEEFNRRRKELEG